VQQVKCYLRINREPTCHVHQVKCFLKTNG
jgi:hypothetical protein